MDHDFGFVMCGVVDNGKGYTEIFYFSCFGLCF